MNEHLEYDVSIVLPCYQEEGQILKGAREIFRVMTQTDYTFEMIFVEDGSSDKTREKILEASSQFSNVTYILHENNSGRGGSFADGAKTAKGKYIGFLDIDLEISCAYLPKIINELENGCDAAIIKRSYDVSWIPLFFTRHFTSVFYKWLVRILLAIPPMDTETGFKFFKRECLLSLLDTTQTKGWFFDTEIMTLAYKNHFKIKEIDGQCVRNPNKTSTVQLLPDGVKQFSELLKFRKKLKRELNANSPR